MDMKVDARGLLCPEPVLLTMKAIKQQENGVIEVLVDNNAAKENVTRLAENKGWKVSIENIENDYIISLSK